MDNSVQEALMQQFQEEIGDQENLSKETIAMYMQKYGFSDPILTQSEKNLILKEQRQRG